jgi:hypothetical protein
MERVRADDHPVKVDLRREHELLDVRVGFLEVNIE